MSKKTHYRLMALGGALLLGAATRLLPHPPNFTPILSLAIIGGMFAPTLSSAVFVTLGSMLISDAFLGLHGLIPLSYATLALVAWLSRRISIGRFSSAIKMSLIGPILFFLTTNFGVWAFSSLYPKTFSGFILCFELALPFFQNSLLSTLLYTALLYAALRFVTQINPMRPHEIAAHTYSGT